MRRLINNSITTYLFSPIPHYSFYKPKIDQPPPQPLLKNSMFQKKTFAQIISIIKNPDTPYPKNFAYYHAVLQCILDQSNQNSKIMIDHGDVIHLFLQQIMERIKIMGSKELSEILALNKFRPKALRFDKEFLITMHVRFETRIIDLIEINEKNTQNVNPEERLTLEDLRNQIQGLFYLKKNTNILSKVLKFSYNMILKKQANSQQISEQLLAKQKQLFFSIIEIINQNLDDTIDPVRESIADFIQQNYRLNQLPQHKEVLRMIVKCKFYKNYPIVRNEEWIHNYVYSYMNELLKKRESSDIQELMSVLKSVIAYTMHVNPHASEGFVSLAVQGYKTAKAALLSMNYNTDKEQLAREVNTISHQIKLIPSYLYLINGYKINTIDVQNGNKIDSRFTQKIIDEIRPILKKFVLCYFELEQSRDKNGKVSLWLANSIEKNIEALNNIIKVQDQPEKILFKSVQNLLNTVTVFKDYNIINVDVQFSLLLVETEIIYCILCRNWITDQVRYLRLLQHAVFVIGEMDREIQQGNPKTIAHIQRFNRVKSKLQEELLIYDNMDKTYKQFTVLRLVSILKCMKMKPKYLGDFYRNVRMRKPNIYVETLSRTMLKAHNFQEVIEAFNFMSEGKIPVKEIELGRIVFLSSKEPEFLRYWMHTNRQLLINKICFCRRIINNIVSIIRMDNLEINRNSIQILAEIVIENKIYEINNHFTSNNQESNQLKKVLCNNFSILFRYSKMDSMIDDSFVVHKNLPTTFKNMFSHIELAKILSFSSYLSEEQSIFYINRQNKNALFKYVIMLMKKWPYCEKSREHFLLGRSYNEQKMMLEVVNRVIEQYWPENKLTNKGMPFYCEFLAYFIQINKFDYLVKNQNTVFLIIKEILQDYKQVQSNSELKHIVSRIEHNYERLHFLSIFENQTQISNTLESVLSSMNFVMDIKIFSDFVAVIETWIRKEIEEQKVKRLKGVPKVVKQWDLYNVDKHLINLLVIEKVNNLDNVTDYEILSLMTISVFAFGTRDCVNQNMQLILRRLLKINPVSAKLTLSQQLQKKKFPFQLFKLVMSNLNIYTENRQKRQLLGKQIIAEDLAHEKLCEWMIKCLLTYAREIQNNEQLDAIARYLNGWNVDVLTLIRNKFFDLKINLQGLCSQYFSVEILAFLWGQNIIRFNKQQPNVQSQFSNEKIVLYIKRLLTQMHETHLMNNYGIYFQEDGQKALNIIKALLMGLLQTDFSSIVVKQVPNCLKKIKELVQEFTKISNKAQKYNKLRGSSKYAYMYNDDQGQVVDMLDMKPTIGTNHERPDVTSKNLKTISMFSEILDIMMLIKLGKWSIKNLSQQHLTLIKNINTSITKRQKALLIDSELTYFTDSQPILQVKNFQEISLKLYVKKTSNSNSKLTVYYLVSQKQSLLYDFSYKKRRRVNGQEQLVIDYIESLLNLSRQMEGQNGNNGQEIEIKVLPNNLSKVELKKIIGGG